MPRMPIAECAHLRFVEWLGEPDEWLYEPEVGASDPLSRALQESVRKALVYSRRHHWVLLSHKGLKAAVDTSAHHRHKKQAKAFIIDGDSICDSVVRSEDAALTGQRILRDLKAMLEEQNEPDFRHSPTEYAYNTARRIIENLYTHYLGSAPIPTIAPDGGGGIIGEWKSGQRIVRLIVSGSQDGKSYVYSRGATRSQIDHSASGLTLSQQLCSIFPD